MKRFVALICVLMMSMTFVCTAHAEVSHTCSWVLQNTGVEVYRSVSSYKHILSVEQIAVCTTCGATNGTSYAPKLGASEVPHITNGEYVYNIHRAGTQVHVFYQKCNYCYAYCFPAEAACSGANGAHVQSP